MLAFLASRYLLAFAVAKGYWDKAEMTDCLEPVRLFAAQGSPGSTREQLPADCQALSSLQDG